MLYGGGEEPRRKGISTRSKPKKGSKDSPLFGPASAPGATGTGDKRRTGGIFSNVLFPKRRSSNAIPASEPRRQPEPSAEAIQRGVDILKSIFPKWERIALQMMLEANGYIMEPTITAILNMDEVDGESQGEPEELDSNSDLYPIKHALPVDFLQVCTFVNRKYQPY